MNACKPMTTAFPSRQRPRPIGHVLPSLILLCAPIAFQLAGSATQMSDAMWIMLLLSLWSSLVAGCLAIGMTLRLILTMLIHRMDTRPMPGRSLS